MKRINTITAFTLIALLSTSVMRLSAQNIEEVTEPLSKKALKGYLHNISSDPDNIHVTYKIKGDKKSNEIFFERYSFDGNLKFTGISDVREDKQQKEDYESIGFYAQVGGANSFEVLSQKLKIVKTNRLVTWNNDRQRYEVKKYLSREVVKPRNDEGKVYIGYASYPSVDLDKSELLILAKSESKDKEQDAFLMLLFDESMTIKEKVLDLTGPHSLVFCEQLESNDVVAIFAPKKGAANLSKYVYFRMDIKGNVKSRVEFNSPASAVLISAAYEDKGDVYFFGTSSKSTESFEKTFSEYSPIFNPGFSGLGRNSIDLKWQKALNKDMENFHLLKLNDKSLAFASTTPVKEFKAKFKTAPGDKGASAYKGKKFEVFNFRVIDNGDYLVSGQITSSVMLDGTMVESYEDILCFQFDKNGTLKAQYGIGKVSNDKKSAIFSNTQRFFPSVDGNTVYWTIFEVKGFKGYESFADAFNGNATFYPRYYPRITKIDLASSTLSAVQVPGNGKYFLRRNLNALIDEKNNSITYFGHDEKYSKLWLSRVTMP